MGFVLKSSGSSIIIESFTQAVRERAEGSKAPELMNVGDTIVGSIFTGSTIWVCLGKGLFMGGVGGALLRANGLSKANDRDVEVPLNDVGVDT